MFCERPWFLQNPWLNYDGRCLWAVLCHTCFSLSVQRAVLPGAQGVGARGAQDQVAVMRKASYRNVCQSASGSSYPARRGSRARCNISSVPGRCWQSRTHDGCRYAWASLQNSCLLMIHTFWYIRFDWLRAIRCNPTSLPYCCHTYSCDFIPQNTEFGMRHPTGNSFGLSKGLPHKPDETWTKTGPHFAKLSTILISSEISFYSYMWKHICLVLTVIRATYLNCWVILSLQVYKGITGVSQRATLQRNCPIV